MSQLASYVTSDALLKVAELKSSRTLRRWQKAGLLPRPVNRPHPNGRGRANLYPASAVERVQKIASMRAQGVSIDDIRIELELDAREDKVQALIDDVMSWSFAGHVRAVTGPKTVVLALDLGFDVCRIVPVFIYGIEPLHGQALACKEYLSEFLGLHTPVVAQTIRCKLGDGTPIYDARIEAQGRDVATLLVDRGLATWTIPHPDTQEAL